MDSSESYHIEATLILFSFISIFLHFLLLLRSKSAVLPVPPPFLPRCSFPAASISFLPFILSFCRIEKVFSDVISFSLFLSFLSFSLSLFSLFFLTDCRLTRRGKVEKKGDRICPTDVDACKKPHELSSYGRLEIVRDDGSSFYHQVVYFSAFHLLASFQISFARFVPHFICSLRSTFHLLASFHISVEKG